MRCRKEVFLVQASNQTPKFLPQTFLRANVHHGELGSLTAADPKEPCGLGLVNSPLTLGPLGLHRTLQQ